MKRSHSSIGCPSASRSSRAAVAAKRLAAAETPPVAPVHLPCEATSPCLIALSEALGLRSRWLPADETICDDGARPSPASHSLVSWIGPSLEPKWRHRRE